MRGVVVLADRAQDQARCGCGRATARRRPPARGREIDDRVVARRGAARATGRSGEAREVEAREGGGGGCPNRAGRSATTRPRPKRVSARPVATWLRAGTGSSTPKSSASAAPASAAGDEAERRAAGGHGGGEAGDGADDHHALDAEVEHAGLLDHQLADGGEEERGGREDQAGERAATQADRRRRPSGGPPRRSARRGSGSGCRARAGRTAACPGRPRSPPPGAAA